MERILIAVAGLFLASAPALAQALDTAPTKPVAELLNDGFAVVSSSTNGRPGEVVLLVRREAKHYACVLTDFRGSNYSDPKAKPAAQACVPLN